MRFIRNIKFNTNRRVTPLAVAVAVLLTFCLVAGIGARYLYVRSNTPVSQVSALDFYFTVDLLGDTNELSQLNKDIHLFGGNEKTVSFNVQNYFDELRTNAKDITYKVTLSDDNDSYDGYTLTKKTGDASEAAQLDTALSMTKDVQQTDEYILSLPAGYEAPGVNTTVTATVKSSIPYVKEMKLNFILHSDDAPMTYRVEDKAGDNYATLIVMSNAEVDAGKLVVDWSGINTKANVLQIDTTSPQVLDGTVTLTTNDPNGSYLSSVTTTKALTKLQSIQIYFFKSDPSKNYSIPDTAVTADASGTYTVKIPAETTNN